MNQRLFACWACAPLCLGLGAAHGQATSPPDAGPEAASVMSVAPAASGAMPTPLIGLDGKTGSGGLRSRAALLSYQSGARQDDSVALVSVITLPPEPRPGRPPGRNHHALSLRSETSTQALRSVGFDVTDCATRFRLPSKFKQGTANAEGGFEAAAQVSWLCRF